MKIKEHDFEIERDETGMDAEAIYYAYSPMVIRRCRALLCNEEEAHDAVSEIFVKLLTDDCLTRMRSRAKYIWTMATNHCLNLLKSRARWDAKRDGETMLKRIVAQCPDDDFETRVGYRHALRKLFGQHPKSTRVIAVLHLVDGMTLEETARVVGLSKSGVRKRLRRLKESLKEMGDMGEL